MVELFAIVVVAAYFAFVFAAERLGPFTLPSAPGPRSCGIFRENGTNLGAKLNDAPRAGPLPA